VLEGKVGTPVIGNSLKRIAHKSTGRSLKFAVLLICVVAGSCARAEQLSNHAEDFVQVEMRNIFYHFNNRVAVHILQLEGKLVPARRGAVPVFDNKQSFVLGWIRL
jgi:hypothetical protein